MTQINEVKHAIEASWPALPAAGLCVRLLDFFVHLPEAETRLMTMPMLAKGVGLATVNHELLGAITILVSSKFELLQARAMLIEDDDEEFELGPETLSRARAEGCLAHPETGEEIENFEQKLYPFFVPTDRLKAMLQEQHGA